VQTGGEEEERHAVRSLMRRRSHGDEAMAGELEEVSVTTRRRRHDRR
jgi:hypothetical protein